MMDYHLDYHLDQSSSSEESNKRDLLTELMFYSPKDSSALTHLSFPPVGKEVVCLTYLSRPILSISTI